MEQKPSILPVEPTQALSQEERWKENARIANALSEEVRGLLAGKLMLIVEDQLLNKHRVCLGFRGFSEGKHFIMAENLDAVRLMTWSEIAILITDMDFPLAEGGPIFPNAGMQLLQEANRQGVPAAASTSREDYDCSYPPNISKGNYGIQDLEIIRNLLSGLTDSTPS